MTTQYRTGQPATFSFWGFLLSVILGAVALAVFLHVARTGIASRVATLLSGRQAKFDISVPIVVDRIQSLNRLETVSYSLDTVVENKISSPILPDILAGDKILLVVHGQSVAGIDLSKLKPEDVRIDGSDSRSIHVTLPASEIFLTITRQRAYQGLLPHYGVADPSRPRTLSQPRAGEGAAGVAEPPRFRTASSTRHAKNARADIAMLLTALGFTHVDVK